ncbi:MAG: GNAT family N-acetyltransferase [Jatrophihabitans sp.]|uniref:GNAT family N-acetyltransferase n=1 Tax=Jatrophihabitans sp. TaxID=1932789 RepID=UPI0039140F69
MNIRAQRRSDDDAVGRVLLDAFGRQRVVDLAAALLARADAPGVALVAEDEAAENEDDNTLIGHVQLSRSWIDAPDRLVEVLVLSPLGVAPHRQRQGVGRALCAAALEGAQRAGAPAVFLEGDPAYYARLGWEPASRYGVTPPSTRIPERGLQMTPLPGWRPDMAGALVYNDTFWSHDCVGLR